MSTVVPLVCVALGSAFGGVGRYLLSSWMDAHWKESAYAMSIGTLAVNIIGSFCIAFFAARCESEAAKAFVLVGIMGGFTTFSSFSWQVVQHLQAQQWWQAGVYVSLSFICCVAAAAAGYFVSTISTSGA